MHREGHIGLGLLAFSPLAYLLASMDATVFLGLGLVATAFFSYAPDYDLEIQGLDHRGLTHTYLAAGVAGVVSAVVITGLSMQLSTLDPLIQGNSLANSAAVAGLGFTFGALGVLSHIFGDILTPMGVNPRQPFGGETVSLDLFYASSELANGAFFMIGALALTAAMYAGLSL